MTTKYRKVVKNVPFRNKPVEALPVRCTFHRKLSYRSQDDADMALKWIAFRHAQRPWIPKVPVRAYEGPLCGFWHLTSEEEW